jgi:ABC-type taurine transport system substrate-binding protein
MADADAKYRDGGKNWKADGAEVKAIAKWSGSKPKMSPAIALYKFPP